MLVTFQYILFKICGERSNENVVEDFLDFLCQIIWKSGIVTIKAWNVHIGPTEHNYTLSNMFTMYRLYIQGTLYVVRCALTPLYKMFWFALNGSLKFSTETQVEKISPPNFTTWRRQVANFNPHHFPDNWIEIRISADSCSSDFYFFFWIVQKSGGKGGEKTNSGNLVLHYTTQKIKIHMYNVSVAQQCAMTEGETYCSENL